MFSQFIRNALMCLLWLALSGACVVLVLNAAGSNYLGLVSAFELLGLEKKPLDQDPLVGQLRSKRRRRLREHSGEPRTAASPTRRTTRRIDLYRQQNPITRRCRRARGWRPSGGNGFDRSGDRQ